MFLIPASSLQLIWTSCRRGYIIIWRPLFFLRASQFRTQFNPSTVKVISWYSSTRCTCYLHRCISYFDSLAGRRSIYNTTSRCRGGRYSFPWIAPIYPWYIPYITECWAGRYQVTFLKSLIWRDVGLNSGLPDHWRTLYPQDQLAGDPKVNLKARMEFELA